MRNGAAGQRWLEALPDVVAGLALRWRLELGEAFGGGTAGYVVAATDDVGRACVLKVAMPLDMNEHDDFARSVHAHELAAGRGCAELLAGWCSVDPQAVWEWGFIERVSTGLANVRDFDNDDGATFLEVARRCL